MLLVIEGPDRTGKTSLANRIADKIGARVIHAGPPTRHPIEEYETALNGYDPRSGDHIVLDRWHIGEYVWPKVFGRETKFTEPVQRHVEMFMRSRGAFVIYACRNFGRLWEDIKANDEPIRSSDALHQAIGLFECALASWGSYGTWNFEKDSDSRVDNFIMNAEAHAAYVSRVWDAVGPGWVGNSYPRALLVGDELGPKKDYMSPPDDIPFAPYDATSGRYLLGVLREYRKTALVNSLQGRNQTSRDLRAVWDAFGRPAVVALGKRSAAALGMHEVPHVEVPHPQYWRRFRYNEPGEYGARITEAFDVT